MTIHAVYENGVFRPMEEVALPDPCEVEVEIRQMKESSKAAGRLSDLPKWTGQVFGRLTREEIYDSGA